MALNPEQIGRLFAKIRKTREIELTCPECLDELDSNTQRFLDGAPIGGVLERVQQHLEACRYCTGQFELVLDTLKAIEEE